VFDSTVAIVFAYGAVFDCVVNLESDTVYLLITGAFNEIVKLLPDIEADTELDEETPKD